MSGLKKLGYDPARSADASEPSARPRMQADRNPRATGQGPPERPPGEEVSRVGLASRTAANAP